MDPSLATGYKSRAQIARVVTQSWTAKEAYCPSCQNGPLVAEPENTKVIDFNCERCDEPYQLKSQGHPFSAKIVDSAYRPMYDVVISGHAPNFILLHYDQVAWRVIDLLAVNRRLLTVRAVVPRPALRPPARRAGWVGCWIDLQGLPDGALVPLIQNGLERDHAVVQEQWGRFNFVASQNARTRGWLTDVFSCVRQVGKAEFSLRDIYAFEDELRRLHPENRNIQPKIRQQLQLLIRHGVVRRVRPGVYQPNG